MNFIQAGEFVYSKRELPFFGGRGGVGFKNLTGLAYRKFFFI